MFGKKPRILIKNEKQIDGIRKASKLAAETLKYLEQFAIPGNTTKYIDQKCAEFTHDHGAVAATKNYGHPPFPGHCCTSVNDVVCHGIPSNYELKDGDILNIDVTPILGGYYGDTCKMYPIGEISKEASDLIEITRQSLWKGIEEVRPGNRFGNIGFAISQFVRPKRYSVVFEFAGHGVGVDFHEEPQIDHNAPKDTGEIMRPGMIFTIEPMINIGKARCKIDKFDKWTARTIDGKLSAQFEHTILVTEKGYEALTDLGDF